MAHQPLGNHGIGPLAKLFADPSRRSTGIMLMWSIDSYRLDDLVPVLELVGYWTEVSKVVGYMTW